MLSWSISMVNNSNLLFTWQHIGNDNDLHLKLTFRCWSQCHTYIKMHISKMKSSINAKAENPKQNKTNKFEIDFCDENQKHNWNHWTTTNLNTDWIVYTHCLRFAVEKLKSLKFTVHALQMFAVCIQCLLFKAIYIR